MFRLFETIKIKHNSLQNIAYHNHRVNTTRNILFQAYEQWDLSEMISIPQLDANTIYRCRFLYARKPEGLEFIPYIPRIVKRLYLVDCGDFEYSFKYADRSEIDRMRNNIPDPEFSDALFVKNGFITDTSFSNIALFDGKKWYTPVTPLLKGTKREYYIENKIIFERKIKVANLDKYWKVRMINAMLDMENEMDIPVECIIHPKIG